MTGRMGWLLVVAVAAVAACSNDRVQHRPDIRPMSRHVLEHDGLEREYFVFLPSTYDEQSPYPVLFFLHGYGGTATGTEAEVTQGLNSYAEQYGYVAVYPQSTWFMAGDSVTTQWEATSWNHITDAFDKGPAGPICATDATPFPCPPECGNCGHCGWASCHDDVGFLKRLVHRIAADFVVESGSVFVAGFSNGAQMANWIGCEAPELFAGVALVAGRIEPGFECTPSKPLPLLQITGDQDATIPYDGRVSSSGYFYSSTTSVAEYWNDGAACATDADKPRWTSPALSGADVHCTIACGATAHPSIDCIWSGGNHRWPGTADFIGSNGYCVTKLQAASMPEQTICVEPDRDAKIWGSRLMFEFFDEHRGS